MFSLTTNHDVFTTMFYPFFINSRSRELNRLKVVNYMLYFTLKLYKANVRNLLYILPMRSIWTSQIVWPKYFEYSYDIEMSTCTLWILKKYSDQKDRIWFLHSLINFSVALWHFHSIHYNFTHFKFRAEKLQPCNQGYNC